MLGLGSMGAPMARHLIDKGYSVCGYDPQDAARRAAAKLGVKVMDSAREVARTSELAIVVVCFDHEVEAVMFGPQGVMAGAGAGLIVVVGSTISPRYARQLADRDWPDAKIFAIPRDDAAWTPAPTGCYRCCGGH